MKYEKVLLGHQIIPCDGGWRVVYETDDNDEPLYVGDPVIAWNVRIFTDGDNNSNSHVEGITLEGTPERCEGFFGYLRPDGKIECMGYMTFDSLAHAIQETKQEKRDNALRVIK